MTHNHANRAFTLVELIIAIFILGIGMISIASLFPAGIKQQEIAEDDVYGPLVARHAMELLRTRLRQDDFGCFEEFSGKIGFIEVSICDPIPLNANTGQYVSAITYAPTIAKDWIWKRPGFISVDDGTTPDRDEAGMYDIFSYYGTRKNVGGARTTIPVPLPSNFTPTTLLSDVAITSTLTNRLYGIPYNREIYDQQLNVGKTNYAWTFAQSTIPQSGLDPAKPDLRNIYNLGNSLREPAVFITQRERYWPMPANAVGVTPTPRYVWDCMFRRFNGRILVGMFVYRVIPANGLMGGNPNTMTPYVSAAVTSALDPINATRISKYPPIPQWVSSRSQMGNLSRSAGDGANNVWGAGGLDTKVGKSTINTSKYSPFRDDCAVPGTGPSTLGLTDPTALSYSETWQQPGQWMIDQYNNVHHVIEGRRTHDDGPVILAKPVPRQPYSNALIEATTATERDNNTKVNKKIPDPGADDTALLATPGSGGDGVRGIQDLWFVPPYDANGNQLLPVYACVEEL
jgi:prepilin-type N-terminal cleavage/methylation domain-containing protein